MSTGSQPSFASEVGPPFVGLLFSIGMYGILCLQTYTYFHSYSDRRHLRYLVAIVWLVETFHTVIISDSIYYYDIVNYNNPNVLNSSTWTVNIHVVVTAFVAFLIQNFFAYRIYILSECNKLVTGIITLLSFIQLAFGSVVTIRAFTIKYFVLLTTAEWSIGSFLGTTLACDIFITLSMCYYLHGSRTGFKRTDSLVNTLILYALSTGAITAAIALANLITFFSQPTSLVTLGLNFILAKVYSNSLLATLNARKHLNARLYKTQDFTINLTGVPSSDVNFDARKTQDLPLPFAAVSGGSDETSGDNQV
ncbi:hypothetical protein BJ138DRAFT_800934 [Hygrophoropsis aurantiaca]|uniref:Uncharacterized protein n=1 Tax=Hygrophoropsis aurantiaca TaxID=72124 RepID=A0ACB8AGT0_9AGAM|nr:hypothetical protein BJ138DRAFT_800934 [Hygrophoropsis aurantiaca]